MKKISCCFALLICMLILAQSCKKDNSAFISEKIVPSTTPDKVNVSLRAGETFQFDLGVFGSEETATINRQAAYYEISTIVADYSSGRMTYMYKPTVKYVGTDEVELKCSNRSNGGCSNSNAKMTTIKFTITN